MQQAKQQQHNNKPVIVTSNDASSATPNTLPAASKMPKHIRKSNNFLHYLLLELNMARDQSIVEHEQEMYTTLKKGDESLWRLLSYPYEFERVILF